MAARFKVWKRNAKKPDKRGKAAAVVDDSDDDLDDVVHLRSRLIPEVSSHRIPIMMMLMGLRLGRE